jgi:hypothetical protein
MKKTRKIIEILVIIIITYLGACLIFEINKYYINNYIIEHKCEYNNEKS